MKSGNSDREFEALLEYLRINRYFDFSGYKPSTAGIDQEIRGGVLLMDVIE
jgi:hypothetical protein